MPAASPENRNFNTISPSARSLLLLKGLTDIPFAHEVASLISLPEKYEPDFEVRDPLFWGRVLHFENRYKSIDQLLWQQPTANILELSSGFSFRGLAAVRDKAVHYIDTDLPELVATKQALLAQIAIPKAPAGTLELLPLNALDENAFQEITDRFAPGPLTIVNEGLLMYLDIDEKKQVCKLIRRALEQRGGSWITADIYVGGKVALPAQNDQLAAFFKQHRIEENKFETFETARTFFTGCGFNVQEEAVPVYQQTTALSYLIKSLPAEKLHELGKRSKIQATWRLTLS